MFFNKAFCKRCRTIYSLTIILLSLHISAQTWTGNVNSDWNNSANWTGWPLNGANITIDPANYTGAAASPVISANSVFTPAGMIVQNGATLTVQANLTTTRRIELFNNGTLLSVSGGTLLASGGGSQGRFIVSDGAAVIQNNGTVRANQRVIVELGGSYTLNNGTVNPVQELAIGDGNALGSSLFDMNGGTLTIGQGIGFENEAGLYYPTFDMSGGIATIGGDVSWLGVAPGAGTPRFLMSGGMATIGGSILNDPATTVDLYMHLSGNADLAFTGPAVTLVNATDSIKHSGLAVMTLSNTHTVTNPGVWHATGGTVIFSGSSTIQGTGTYQFHRLIINTARTLNHVSPASISVTGDVFNNGTFNANMNTVVFSGTVAQSIQGSSLTAFRNLSLSNSSATGLTLNKGITVSGTLQLNAGKLNSSAANLITLMDNATSSSGSSGSFVNGPLKKIGDDAFIFPVGKNTRWRRLAISAPTSLSSEFIAEYFESSYPNLSPVNSPLQAVTSIEYWKLDRLNSTDAVQPSFYWEDALASAISNCTQLSTAHWNGASWDNILSAATGTCTGNGAGSLQANTALSNLGIFTFGFMGIVNAQNLTVCSGGSVTVGAHTYTTSGTYVDILTASDLSDSTVITRLNVLPVIITNQSISLCHGQVFSVGPNTYSVSGNYSDILISGFGCDSTVNTALTIQGPVNVSVTQNDISLSSLNTTATHYQWVDCANQYAVLNGQTAKTFTATTNGSYAVIVTEQVCKDTSACFTIVSVSIDAHALRDPFSLYPNPSPGKVTIESGIAGTFQVRLFDVTGRLIQTETISELKKELDYSQQETGIYFLEVSRGDKVSRIKLVKN